MQRLRNARPLARLVLAWFALFVAAAALSSIMRGADPQDFVCSASGMVVAAHAGDADKPIGPLAMKCPLCMPMHAPPAPETIVAVAAQPLGHVLQSIPAARIAALTAAPLPARGPPAFLPA